MPDFTLLTDPDGIATLIWDVPGRSMNVMSEAGFAELDRLMTQALGDPAVRGIILTSGKQDFAGGMDLGVIARIACEAGY